MKLKTKLKSIYRRYKKYPAAFFILLNIVLTITPPYSTIGIVVQSCFTLMFVTMLMEQRNADVRRRYAIIAIHHAQRIVEKNYTELYAYRENEAKRKVYSGYRFCAGDQFYYEGRWHNVASVNFDEDLIAYDISTDEDDDMQLVWLRFENIESYRPHKVNEQ